MERRNNAKALIREFEETIRTRKEHYMCHSLTSLSFKKIRRSESSLQ